MRGVRRAGSLGNGQGHRSGFGSSDSYLLDPLLLPRLEQYAHNNQLSNIDSTVEYLRRNYREYRRKQQGPFRKLVIKAVHIIKKRIPEGGADEILEERVELPARALDDGEEILQEREAKHVMRFRSGVGRHNGELEAESLDNSSENSDGVESEGMSEGGGGEDGQDSQKRSHWIERIAGVKERVRDGTGKAVIDRKGKGPASERKRISSRRAGNDKDTSDSEEELAFDGMEEERPNLLNSSLRATYNGRPSLIIESPSGGEKNGYVGSSSSLYKFSLPRKTHPDVEHVLGESSRAILISAKGVEVDEKPAFAAPSVIAEAAKVALLGKRCRKIPVIDQETKEAFGRGSANGTNVDRSSPPAQSSGRPPQGQKLRGNFQSPAYSAPEGISKAPSHPRAASEVRAHEEGRSLERERSIGTWESSGQVPTIKSKAGEHEKSRDSKRRKWDNGKHKDGPESGDRVGSLSSLTPQNVSFKDLGGIEDTIEIIRNVIEYPLAHPELYEWLGVHPPRGVLLHGPPGCGKTMLANAIAVEARVPFLKISAPEVVSGMSGESEAKVRALFAEAVRVAPCIIFIDEIDAITPKRETAQREMERRIVAQLLTCMDDLGQTLYDKDESSAVSTKRRFRHVVVIGATNRPDALDPALRRAGRFDREIALGIPDEVARAGILSVLAKKLRLEGSFDFKLIARRTPGFVGADLAALIKEAAAVAVKRIFKSRDPRLNSSVSPSANCVQDSCKTGNGISEDCKSGEGADAQHGEPSTLAVVRGTRSTESASVCGELDTDDGEPELWRRPWSRDEMESLSITMQDFEEAVSLVQPSAKREGFTTIPDVSWDDVGSLGTVREELEFSISRPIKHPEEYQAMGLNMATGVLLYGPPGCGKTLVAKAIANEAGANFISVKGPELLNKYVGESERAVRQLFTRARASSPCVLFFDEMDAMAPRRGSDGNAAAERVVNQLLTEMDGLEQRKSIFVIAATNRPDMIDPALLRPGRLDKLLYVPLPDPKGRGSIMKTLIRKVPLASDVDVAAIGESERCEGFSGADLASLVREACIASLRAKDHERSLEPAPRGSDTSQLEVTATAPLVTNQHFNAAFIRVFPSVSNKDRMLYDNLCKKLRRARAHISNSEPEVDGKLVEATA